MVEFIIWTHARPPRPPPSHTHQALMAAIQSSCGGDCSRFPCPEPEVGSGKGTNGWKVIFQRQDAGKEL